MIKAETEETFAIKHSDVMGRYLVAAKDLKQGELVIEELPLAIGPCGDREPICLGCYVELAGGKKYRCLGCGWPLCGPKCPGLKKQFGHSSEECSTLREKRVSDLLDKCDTNRKIQNMYEIILPLRCLLLKKSNKEMWAKFTKMEAHNEIRKKITTLWSRNQELIVNRLRNVWGVKEFTEEEIHTACGILEVNCFEVGQNGARARAIYPSAFLLSHDCCPNTTHTDHPKTHAMTLRVTQLVKKGDAITLSYAYTLQVNFKERFLTNCFSNCFFFWHREL